MALPKTCYAVIATGHDTPIDDLRDRLFALLGGPKTLRLLSYAARPSGIVTHDVAEVRFVTDADEDRLALIEAAELED